MCCLSVFFAQIYKGSCHKHCAVVVEFLCGYNDVMFGTALVTGSSRDDRRLEEVTVSEKLDG